MGKILISALAITILISALTGSEYLTSNFATKPRNDISSVTTNLEDFSALTEKLPSLDSKEKSSVISSDDKRELPTADNHSTTESTPISTDGIDLNGYFGSWDIVEDFGYIGISRDQFNAPLMGEKVSFLEDGFRIAGGYEYITPLISAEMVDPYEMTSHNRYVNPEFLGFDPHKQCVRILIEEPIEHFKSYLYVLSNEEIVFDGGNNRYYRAEKE